MKSLEKESKINGSKVQIDILFAFFLWINIGGTKSLKFFFLNCCFFHDIVCWGNLGNELLNDYGLHSQHPTNVLEFYCYPVYFPDIFCTGLESLRFLVPTFWLCLDCKVIYLRVLTTVRVWLDLCYKSVKRPWTTVWETGFLDENSKA